VERIRSVLLVEDNPGDSRLLAEMLRDLGGDTTLQTAETLTSGIEAVGSGEYDVVLLDLGLPESVGIETYRRLKMAAPEIAVVVLTGNTDIQLAVSAVDEGAQDFLVKGQFDEQLLGRAMAYAVSRKQAETDLRRQTARLEEAQRFAHMGSWRVDARTFEVDWSREIFQIAGIPYDTQIDNLEQVLRESAHPDDAPLLDAAWAAAQAGEDLVPLEYRLVRPDGEIRWVYRSAEWERDENGSPLSLKGIMQDITERVMAREAVRRSEAINRLLIEGLREFAVLLISEDGVIGSWNAGAERIFGLSAQEADDVVFPQLAYDEAGADALRDVITEAAREGRASVSGELRRGASGSFWAEIWMSALESPDHSAGDLTVVIRDETESKRHSDQEAVRLALTETIAKAQSLDAAWNEILRDVCFGLGYEFGEAWVLDEQDDVLRFAGIWSPDRESLDGLESTNTRCVYRHSELPLWYVIRGAVPAIDQDLESVAEGVRLFELRRAGAKTVSVVPIADSGRVYGAFLLYASTPDSAAEQSATLLTELSGLTAQFAARERLKDQVEAVGLYDPVTGLPNRALFVERVSQALTRKPLRGEPAVLVVKAEVDQYDPVSDTYGMVVGDRLLLSVAERLGAALGTGDMVARLAGGVFGVLVNDVKSAAQESAVLDRLASTLVAPIELGGANVYATLSTGSSRGGATDNAEEVMRCAAIALHQARSSGRGGRVVFDQGMRDVIERALSTEGELRKALDADQFVVYYQPILDIRSRQIVGAEALIRWMHPTRGLVPPGEFIPTAEATGLIAAIGARVLRVACTECAGWTALTGTRLGVAVNLSANQLVEGDLAQFVLAALQDASLAPGLLTLEITESVIMSDAEKAVRVLDRLRDVGVCVSVDDFGTGYSSLSYLKRLAIDSVKVDRSFVSGLPRDSEDCAIVVAVQNMAHALGLRVIAEGVESFEQFEFLDSHECDEAQGFLFARPMPAEEFREFVGSWSFPSGSTTPTLDSP